MALEETTVYFIHLSGYQNSYDSFYEGTVEGGPWKSLIGVFQSEEERDRVYKLLTPKVLAQYAAGAGDSGKRRKSKGSQKVLKKGKKWALSPDYGGSGWAEWKAFVEFDLRAIKSHVLPSLLKRTGADPNAKVPSGSAKRRATKKRATKKRATRRA